MSRQLLGRGGAKLSVCLSALVILLARTVVAQAEVVYESSKDVGFGFREVHRSERLPSGLWEEIGHFSFLFYKDRELSQYGSYSISPSGRYALFQDGPTGATVLFATANSQSRTVAHYAGSRVHQYMWHERQRKAIVLFEDHSSISVALEAP